MDSFFRVTNKLGGGLTLNYVARLNLKNDKYDICKPWINPKWSMSFYILISKRSVQVIRGVIVGGLDKMVYLSVKNLRAH